MDKIKILFKRILVKKDADWFGSGEFYFIATVAGKTVGDKQTFDARAGAWIKLPPEKWSAIVDVKGKSEVVVRFNGKDEDVFCDDDLGTVGHTLRPPWIQRSFLQDTEFFRLEWEVLLLIDGKFEHHAPTDAAVCRASAGNASCTTVSGVPIVSRIEVHPVRPVPAPPAGWLPPRGLPAGPLLAIENKGGTVPTPTDPINIVPNPSVIPILTAPGATPGPNDPPVANATNAARIEVTFYRPNSLAFTDSDPRLVWSVRPINGGGAAFVGPPHGLKVLVYGTADGEVALEVRFRGVLVATYRALVMKVKPITCRVNILYGPDKKVAGGPPVPDPSCRASSTPADVQAHFAIANRYLRQVGLELVFDTNTTVTNKAQPTAIPGIFTISVPKGTTRKVDSDLADVIATRLNYRKGIMNFAYIHSEKRASILGAATDIPASKVTAKSKPAGQTKARPYVEDSGEPSTSWLDPSGVPPDSPGKKVQMYLINAIQRAGHPQLYAMLVCNGCGNPTLPNDQKRYAIVMVHELCHILNLGHRVEGQDSKNPSKLVSNGIFFDGLTHPPTENIMHWTIEDESQDLDIIQTRAVHQSKLVP